MNVLRYLRYWLRTFVWFVLALVAAVIVIGPIVVLATLDYRWWAMGVAVGEFVIALISGIAANAYDEHNTRRLRDELEERRSFSLPDAPSSPFPDDPRLSDDYQPRGPQLDPTQVWELGQPASAVAPPPGRPNPIVKSGVPRRVKPPMPTQFRQFPPGPDRWIRKG